jgi:Mitochondrial carrier protein
MNQVQGMHTDVATLRKNSIWQEASRIVYEEGFKAFWKGNLVTIAHRLPYSSISFYAYERYKHVRALQNLSILFYFILTPSTHTLTHICVWLMDTPPMIACK